MCILFCRQFRTTEDVLKGARHMVAMQIAHDPLVRDTVRETFYERAKISCRPTKKGMKVGLELVTVPLVDLFQVATLTLMLSCLVMHCVNKFHF